MPQVPLDTSERWTARSVCFVAAGVAAGIVASILNHATDSAGMLRGTTFVFLAQLIVLSVVLCINRLGTPQLAARILAVSLPLFAAGLMVASGQGFRDVAVLILPASLILCGLLLDRPTQTKSEETDQGDEDALPF